ncbi:hypothetical protein B0H13DRAFT_200310 [Mycena leptocephala]|nr:hypothetical protein B0H13DRAFT_200310 [Mycena leptocephala]
MSRLYLKNLPVHANREDVFNYLKRFGKLSELKIIASETYSYGFVEFASEQDARFVLDTFRDRLFLGHRTVIELARPLRKDMPSTESHSSRNTARSPRHGVQPKYYSSQAHQRRYPVLVDNIPRHICWQELKDFGRLAGGHVAYCNLDRDRKGCGFIEYLSREDAEEAIRKLNGQKLGGRAVGVSAHSRPPRRRSRSRSPYVESPKLLQKLGRNLIVVYSRHPLHVTPFDSHPKGWLRRTDSPLLCIPMTEHCLSFSIPTCTHSQKLLNRTGQACFTKQQLHREVH